MDLLIRLTFEMLTFSPIKMIIIYVFCQYSFATLLTIYHLLDRFDTKTLLKHGSFCGIQIFVLINLGSIIFMADTLFKLLKKYKIGILPLELLNDEIFRKTLLLGNMVKIVCLLNFLFAIIATLGFIAAPEYFNEKTYLSVWIQETFPDYSNLMLLVVHWSSLPVALVMVGSSIGWAYAGTTAIFQIYVLREFIAAIPKTNFPRKMRLDSKVYQESIKQKFIIAIMVYEFAVSFVSTACDILEPAMIMFSLGSVILGGSLMIEFFSNQEQNFGDQYAIYVGIFFFALAGIISGNLYLLIGQGMKDASEGCNYIMRQFPWYYMNEENKQIYSIFLHRTEKPLCLSCSLMQVDYFLLVRIVKSLYSLAAVLAQFVSSHGPTDTQ
ncbi:uncharacterized protein LOC123313736 isoform X2 [Coccinella septempunctata]|nr:uncharacterized protein LOC123313736 isoform X2 [Coccinella septempunctata]